MMPNSANNLLSAFPTKATSSPPPPFTDVYSVLFNPAATQYAEAGTALNSLFDSNTPFSVSFWMNVRSLPSPQFVIFNNFNSIGQQGVWLAYDTSNSQWDFQLGVVFGPNYIWVTFPQALSINTWYYGLLSYDGSGSASGVTLSVNVAPVTAVVQQDTLHSSPVSITTFYLAQYTTTVFLLDGYLDEVAVFNSDKSASAAALYNSGTPTNLTGTSGLVTWWRMGDGAVSPTIPDEQGFQDLTLINPNVNSIAAVVPP